MGTTVQQIVTKIEQDYQSLKNTKKIDALERTLRSLMDVYSRDLSDCSPSDIRAMEALLYDAAKHEITVALFAGYILWQISDRREELFHNIGTATRWSGFANRFGHFQTDQYLALARSMSESFSHPGLAIVIGNGLRQTGDIGLVESHFQSASKRFPDDPFIVQRLANVALIRRDFPLADEIMRRVSLFPLRTREELFLPAISDNDGGTYLPIPAPPDIKRNVVLAVAADPHYFNKYAEQLVNSVQKHNPDYFHFHIHIVRFPDDSVDSAILARVSEAAGSFCITERVLPESHRKHAATHFACERFLVLPGLLAAYQRPILTTDIDLICVNACDSVIQQSRQFDMGIIADFDERHEPWDQYWAGLVLVMPTSEGERIAGRIALTINTIMSSHHYPWFADQAALYRVLSEQDTDKLFLLDRELLKDSCGYQFGKPGETLFVVLHGSWTQ